MTKVYNWVGYHRKLAFAAGVSMLSFLTMIITLVEFVFPDSDGQRVIIGVTPPPAPFIYAPNVRAKEQ